MRSQWTARDYALSALSQVERNQAFASSALDQILGRTHGLKSEDRALVTELTYGVLRYRNRLDRAIQPFAHKGLNTTHPAVLRALRLAAYQILMLERIPASAAVDHAVTAVSRTLGKRPAGFVNAVLRQLTECGEPPHPDPQTQKHAYLRQVLAYPEDLAALMEERVGIQDALRLAEALNRRPELILRANTLKTDRKQLLGRLKADPAVAGASGTDLSPEGIRVEGLNDPVRHPLHGEGLYAVQQEGSQMVAHMVDPTPGSRILDACCGSGGKSLHLGALTRNEGSITAVDVNPNRLEQAKTRAGKAGVQGIQWIQHDLTHPLPEPMREAFHSVLLDAPCTGLGALNRHPEAKWRFDAEDPERMAELQRRLMDHAAEAAIPGGTLTYAVCTFTRREGPGQVEAFLNRHPEFLPSDPPSLDNPVHPLLRSPHEMETWPHLHATECFYAARLKRTR